MRVTRSLASTPVSIEACSLGPEPVGGDALRSEALAQSAGVSSDTVKSGHAASLSEISVGDLRGQSIPKVGSSHLTPPQRQGMGLRHHLEGRHVVFEGLESMSKASGDVKRAAIFRALSRPRPNALRVGELWRRSMITSNRGSSDAADDLDLLERSPLEMHPTK